MESTITLFTRKENLYKPGFLRKLYNKISKPENKYLQELVYPEELFVDIIAKLLNCKVDK